MAWPSAADPWYAYGIPTQYGNVSAIDLLSNKVVATTTTPYYFNGNGVVAHRNADGTDTVFVFRFGYTGSGCTDPYDCLDFYNIVPPPSIHMAVNAGSLQISQPLAPGAYFTLFGQGLADANCSFDSTKIDLSCGTTQVFVDSSPARLLYVSPTQINAELPQAVATNAAHAITIKIGSVSTPSLAITVVVQAIAAFQWSPDPKNPKALVPIITNVNYSLVQNPAFPSAFGGLGAGDVGILWATGCGVTNPPILDTTILQAGLAPCVDQPTVTIGGMPATVLYAGRAPGLTPGVNDFTITSADGTQVNKNPGGFWAK